MHGVQVVGCADPSVSPVLQRAYTSHWVSQVSFSTPTVMVSLSPRHDSFSIIEKTGLLSVSILAGDQITQGQYFSYPGRKFRHIAPEYLETWLDDLPVVVGCIAALRCAVEHSLDLVDHRILFARVTDVKEGRLRAAPLVYSSRLGWRIAAERAREPGRSIRDELLERLAAAGFDAEEESDVEES